MYSYYRKYVGCSPVHCSNIDYGFLRGVQNNIFPLGVLHPDVIKTSGKSFFRHVLLWRRKEIFQSVFRKHYFISGRLDKLFQVYFLKSKKKKKCPWCIFFNMTAKRSGRPVQSIKSYQFQVEHYYFRIF